MSKIRVEQQKNEPADIFAIRALSKAVPLMNDNALIALAHWLWYRAHDEVRERAKKAKDTPDAAHGGSLTPTKE